MAEREFRGHAGGSFRYPDRDTLGISPYAAAERADYLPDAALEPRRTKSSIWDMWGDHLLEAGMSRDEVEAFVVFAEAEQMSDGQIAKRLALPETEP